MSEEQKPPGLQLRVARKIVFVLYRSLGMLLFGVALNHLQGWFTWVVAAFGCLYVLDMILGIYAQERHVTPVRVETSTLMLSPEQARDMQRFVASLVNGQSPSRSDLQ